MSEKINKGHSDDVGRFAVHKLFWFGRRAESIPKPFIDNWTETQNQNDLALAASYHWDPQRWRQPLGDWLVRHRAEHLGAEQGGGFPYIRYSGPAYLAMFDSARQHGDDAIADLVLEWWSRMLGLWGLGDPGTGRSYIPGCRMGGGSVDEERDKLRRALTMEAVPAYPVRPPDHPLDMAALRFYGYEARRRGMPAIKPTTDGLHLRHPMHWERYEHGMRLWIPDLGQGQGNRACYGFPVWSAAADDEGRWEELTGKDYLVLHGEATHPVSNRTYHDLAKEWTGRRSLRIPESPRGPWPAMGNLVDQGTIGPGSAPGTAKLPPWKGDAPRPTPPPPPPPETRPLDVQAVLQAAHDAPPHKILEAPGWAGIKDARGGGVVRTILRSVEQSAAKGDLRGVQALAEAIGYGKEDSP